MEGKWRGRWRAALAAAAARRGEGHEAGDGLPALHATGVNSARTRPGFISAMAGPPPVSKVTSPRSFSAKPRAARHRLGGIDRDGRQRRWYDRRLLLELLCEGAEVRWVLVARGSMSPRPGASLGRRWCANSRAGREVRSVDDPGVHLGCRSSDRGVRSALPPARSRRAASATSTTARYAQVKSSSASWAHA